MPSEFVALKVLANATTKEFHRIDKSADRATMFIVREGGRRVRVAAKRAAPVYRGGATRMAKNKQGPITSPNKPINGLLRASIGATKRLRPDGEGGYTNKIGPRGERVHLYEGKIEEQRHYMRVAYEAVLPQMGAISRQAWARATRPRGGAAK